MDISATLSYTAKIIQNLLDSSSSSDEELMTELVELIHPLRTKSIAENVMQAYTDIDFKKKFRISRESATYLFERYSQSYSKRNYKGGRNQTSVETQILAFLLFCGSKTTYREVSNMFKLSLSNAHRCFNNVLNFLVDDLSSEVIKFPRLEDEKQKAASEFTEVFGMPNILGCIGTSYIDMKIPKHVRLKHAKSQDVLIALQGICDSKLRFLDTFVSTGSEKLGSDLLKQSSIEKELETLCSSKYSLLCDSTYHTLRMNYLCTPQGDSDSNYDVIKNAFLLLKSRFPQLVRLDFHNIETMKKFVIACCVLHNICINRKESLPEEVSNVELNS